MSNPALVIATGRPEQGGPCFNTDHADIDQVRADLARKVTEVAVLQAKLETMKNESVVKITHLEGVIAFQQKEIETLTVTIEKQKLDILELQGKVKGMAELETEVRMLKKEMHAVTRREENRQMRLLRGDIVYKVIDKCTRYVLGDENWKLKSKMIHSLDDLLNTISSAEEQGRWDELNLNEHDEDNLKSFCDGRLGDAHVACPHLDCEDDSCNPSPVELEACVLGNLKKSDPKYDALKKAVGTLDRVTRALKQARQLINS
jgi:hypothetical protein